MTEGKYNGVRFPERQQSLYDYINDDEVDIYEKPADLEALEDPSAYLEPVDQPPASPKSVDNEYLELVYRSTDTPDKADTPRDAEPDDTYDRPDPEGCDEPSTYQKIVQNEYLELVYCAADTPHHADVPIEEDSTC